MDRKQSTHVTDANAVVEHAARGLLGVYPAAQCTAHDTGSEMLLIPLPQLLSSCVLAIGCDRMVHEDGLHVKDAHVPSEHLSGELLAVRHAACMTLSPRCSSLRSAEAVSMRFGYRGRRRGTLGWIACE